MSDRCELPLEFDPAAVGLDADDVRTVETLRQRPTHAVYRLHLVEDTAILKWFADSEAVEPKCYEFLNRYGVPTPQVLGRGDRAILIEDLTASTLWRAATAADVESPDFARALATWYGQLHAAGRKALARNPSDLDFLRLWTDELTPERLRAAGDKLAIDSAPGWQRALDALAPLRQAFAALEQTVNYNDFYRGNVAVAADGRVLVFDYDWMVIGPAYSDLRNVDNALAAAARDAFADAYGPRDPREALLDRPLSVLYALAAAADRDAVPKWAQPLLAEVRDGTLTGHIDRALGALY